MVKCTLETCFMKNAKLMTMWIVALAVFLLACTALFIWNAGFLTDKNVAIVVVQRGSVSFVEASGDMTGFVGQRQMQVGQTVQTGSGEALIIVNENFYLWLRPYSRATLSLLDKKEVVIDLDDGQLWYMHVNDSNNFAQQMYLITPLTNTTPANARLLLTYDDKVKSTTTFVVDGSAQVSDEFLDMWLESMQESIKTDTNGLHRVDPSAASRQIAIYQLQKDYALLCSARMQEIQHYGIALNVVKQKFNVTDMQIDDTLRKIDRGEMSAQDLLSQSPVPIPDISRTLSLTANARQTWLIQQNFSS